MDNFAIRRDTRVLHLCFVIKRAGSSSWRAGIGYRDVNRRQVGRDASSTRARACKQLGRDVHRSRLWIRDSPCSGLLRHNSRTTWTQLPDRTCPPIQRFRLSPLYRREISSSIFTHRFTTRLSIFFSPSNRRTFSPITASWIFSRLETAYYDIMIVATPFMTTVTP